ncbi:hypothetical protein HZC07_05550, partial [Candidatus Micrarchaeota archaeon]|nr:hypothetical protein [Candidatus Micrarchaeota archaeon]
MKVRNLIPFLILLLLVFGCTKQSPSLPKNSSTQISPPQNYSINYAIPSPANTSAPQGPIIIGMEYATLGYANIFAPLGISGVKFYPEQIAWGNMQRSPKSSIDFTTLDKLVREYQAAGFTNIVIALKSKSSWASKDQVNNPSPK